MEELLENENFDGERISVVLGEKRQSSRPAATLIRDLAKKHKRLASFLTIALGLGAWAKVIAELFSGFR